MARLQITRRDLRKLEQIAQRAPERLDAAGRALVEEMTNDIILSFGTSPDGQEYTRGTVIHIASQPGYPPNVDTGALRASMHWEPDGKLRWLIMDGVEYGQYLELGTENIDPRPFMVPVFEDWRRKVAGFLRDQGLI